MKGGQAGLHNLRNTCYMNAGLQCLFHTREFYRTFVKNDAEVEKGVLFEFSQVLREVWREGSSVVVPSEFKRMFGSVVKQFGGSDQHDCQEFLSFLLDALHEEMNLVRVRPKFVEASKEGMSEEEVAEVFWRNFCRRNQSMISENLFGQFKSTILCSAEHQSLVFDPFLMVSLPLAKVDFRSFQFIFFKKNLKSPIFKCSFLGNTKSIAKDLKQFASSAFEVDPEHLQIASSIHDFLFDHLIPDASNLEANKVYFIYEVTSYWYFVLNHRKRKVVDSSLSGPAVGYSRILSLEGSETFEDLHRLIFNSLKKQDKGYLKDFPQIQTAQGKDEPFTYTVLYLNKNREQKPCENCQKFCRNCLVSVSSEKIKEKFSFNSGVQTLEILWSKTLGDEDVRGVKSVLSHSTVDHVRRFIENSKKMKIDLKKCVDEFQKEERLEGPNRVFCGKCEELAMGYKRMEFWKLPKVLIFHLKRFKQMQGVKTKDSQFVEFPVEGLVLDDRAGQQMYDLYAVSNHYGDMNFGHYTAFALDHVSGGWYEYDDETVRRVEESQVVTAAAYVLFYQQRVRG